MRIILKNALKIQPIFNMENLILGFLTGGSLILAIGPQNLFVIEQGLKRNFVFTITTICASSDIFLIFLGILFTISLILYP